MRLQPCQIAARLLYRALLDQCLALARNRRIIPGIASLNLAVVPYGLALQFLTSRRIGKLQQNRCIGRVHREGRFECVHGFLRLAGFQRSAPLGDKHGGARIGLGLGPLSDARIHRDQQRQGSSNRGVTHELVLQV